MDDDLMKELQVSIYNLNDAVTNLVETVECLYLDEMEKEPNLPASLRKQMH